MTRPLDFFHGGLKASDLSPAQAAEWHRELPKRCYEAFTNPKHVDHHELNRAMVELAKVAYPGHVDAGGAVADGTPNGETLFK